MKKVFSALILLFIVFFIPETEVFAGKSGIKDAQNKPSLPPKSLAKDNVQDTQICDEPGIFLDISSKYYPVSEEFDKVADDYKKIISGMDFTPFVLDFRYVVRKNWTPANCDKSCEVILLMKIDNSGKLISNEVFRSSGNEIFDKSVIEAIKKSAPFRFMPEKFKFNNLPVLFTFSSDESKNGFEQEKVNDVNFKPYLKNMQKSIKKCWKTPKNLLQSRKTILYFTLNKEGRLTFCKILISSGDKSFDKSTIEALNAAAPFGTFPKAYKGETIDVIFTFDYNIFGDIQENEPLKSMINCSITDRSPSNLTLYSFKNREQKKIFKGYLQHVSGSLGTIKTPRTKDSLLKISFSIDKTGTVQNAKITASNGNDEFNQPVLAQIKNMKFNSIPENLGISNISVEYQFDNIYRPENKQNTAAVGVTAGATGLLILLLGGL